MPRKPLTKSDVYWNLKRVEVPVWSDTWMSGDRFGIVTKVTNREGRALLHVLLDKSHKTKTFLAGDVTEIDSGGAKRSHATMKTSEMSYDAWREALAHEARKHNVDIVYGSKTYAAWNRGVPPSIYAMTIATAREIRRERRSHATKKAPRHGWTKVRVRQGWPETWERRLNTISGPSWYTAEKQSGGRWAFGWSHRRGDVDSIMRGSTYASLAEAIKSAEEHAGAFR